VSSLANWPPLRFGMAFQGEGDHLAVWRPARGSQVHQHVEVLTSPRAGLSGDTARGSSQIGKVFKYGQICNGEKQQGVVLDVFPSLRSTRPAC